MISFKAFTTFILIICTLCNSHLDLQSMDEKSRSVFLNQLYEDSEEDNIIRINYDLIEDSTDPQPVDFNIRVGQVVDLYGSFSFDCFPNEGLLKDLPQYRKCEYRIEENYFYDEIYSFTNEIEENTNKLRNRNSMKFYAASEGASLIFVSFIDYNVLTEPVYGACKIIRLNATNN